MSSGALSPKKTGAATKARPQTDQKKEGGLGEFIPPAFRAANHIVAPIGQGANSAAPKS